MTTLEKLNNLESIMQSLVNDYNAALEKSDLEAMASAEHDLKVNVTDYAGLAMIRFFEQVSDKEDYNSTIIRAVTKLTYTTKSYKIDKEGETVTGMHLTDKVVMVDLRKLCKFNGFKKQWVHTLEKFNLLLTLRAATELGLDKTALRTINDSFYMKEKAKEIEMGKTPTSNNQICKQLQAVVDKILFVASENNPEVNTYKVNSHDVAYLLMCYTKRGKSALKVVCSKHSFVERLVTEILHRVITGKVYDVEYKAISA